VPTSALETGFAQVIVDFHTHAFPDDLALRAVDTLNERVPRKARAVLDGTLGALLRSMNRAGIDRCVICSIATAPKQVDAILQWSLSVADERVVPFGSVHPECADPAAEVRKIARAGLQGIKLHPMYQGFAADERRLWPLYAAVEEAGLILLLHCGRDIGYPPDDDRATPRRVLAAHQAFPGIRLVAAHMGGWRLWDEVLAVLAGTDVYLETSYSIGVCEPRLLAALQERHSPERVVFGSDSPWCEQADALARVREAWPDPAVQAMVLGGNAVRLLDGYSR
jgi:predicted TIM-barrel fold metal-dependent hydrolase